MFFEKQYLLSLLESNFEYNKHILKTITTISNRYINFLAFQNINNVRGRVAEALLHLSRAVYEDLKFNQTFTRKEMAELANTTTETIIRIFSELKKDKIISIENKEITILNLAFIEKLASIG